MNWTLVRILALVAPVFAVVAIGMLVLADGHAGWASLSRSILVIGVLILGTAALLALRLRTKEWRDRPEKALRLKLGRVLVPVLVALMFVVAWMLLD